MTAPLFSGRGSMEVLVDWSKRTLRVSSVDSAEVFKEFCRDVVMVESDVKDRKMLGGLVDLVCEED